MKKSKEKLSVRGLDKRILDKTITEPYDFAKDTTKYICTRKHTGVARVGEGKYQHKTFKKGEIKSRNQFVKVLDNWEICNN